MAYCAVCEVPVTAGVTVQGACPECQSLYKLVDSWATDLQVLTGHDNPLIEGSIQVLKKRLGRFFEIHQQPKTMKWG